MEKPQDGGPAFPGDEAHDVFSEGAGEYQTRWVWTGGMSLRDYFAAKAIGPLIAFEDRAMDQHDGLPIDAIANGAYKLADAMLKARG